MPNKLSYAKRRTIHDLSLIGLGSYQIAEMVHVAPSTAYKYSKHPDTSYDNLEKDKFGGAITKRLEELKETRVWLANQIGVSEQMIYSYIRGESFPKRDKLELILEVLELKKNLEARV